MRTRYIYFGVVGKTKVPTKKGDLFRVRETMAVAHEIGCCLEEWFMRTGAHCGTKTLPIDITFEKNESSGIRTALFKQALADAFEERA